MKKETNTNFRRYNTMKQENIKLQKEQTLGGTATMEQQTFVISEQTYVNLLADSVTCNKSETELVREKLAMAVKYINKYDRLLDKIFNHSHEQKEDEIDDDSDEFKSPLDKRDYMLSRLTSLFKHNNDLNLHRISINLMPEENEQIGKIASRFGISRPDVVDALIDCKKQDLGGTAMKQQTFRVSERTRINLEKKATLARKSKSDIIREGIANAVKYVNEFDSLQNKVDELWSKREDNKTVDYVYELLNALDKRTQMVIRINSILYPEDASNQHQIPVILSSEEIEQLEKIAEHFRISKHAVVESVINYDWNN